MQFIMVIWGLLLLEFTQAYALNLDKQGQAQLHGYAQRIGMSELTDKSIANTARLNGDYTEADLNLNWRIRPTTRLVADVNYRSKRQETSQNTLVSILALNQQLYSAPWGYVSLGVGRLKNTLIGLHSAQDAPLLRDTTEYARVYLGSLVQGFYSIDGARLHTSWSDIKGNLLDVYGYLGKAQSELYGRMKLSVENRSFIETKDYDLKGIKITWQPAEVPGLLLGGTWLVVNHRSDIGFIFPIFGEVKDTLKGEVNMGLLMAQYDWGQWQFKGEVAYPQVKNSMKGQPLNMDYKAAYASMSWRPSSRFLMTLRFDYTQWKDISERLAYLMLGQLGGMEHTLNSHAWVVYGRYRITPRLFTGVEADWIDYNGKQVTVGLMQLGYQF